MTLMLFNRFKVQFIDPYGLGLLWRDAHRNADKPTDVERAKISGLEQAEGISSGTETQRGNARIKTAATTRRRSRTNPGSYCLAVNEVLLGSRGRRGRLRARACIWPQSQAC